MTGLLLYLVGLLAALTVVSVLLLRLVGRERNDRQRRDRTLAERRRRGEAD